MQFWVVWTLSCRLGVLKTEEEQVESILLERAYQIHLVLFIQMFAKFMWLNILDFSRIICAFGVML